MARMINVSPVHSSSTSFQGFGRRLPQTFRPCKIKPDQPVSLSSPPGSFARRGTNEESQVRRLLATTFSKASLAAKDHLGAIRGPIPCLLTRRVYEGWSKRHGASSLCASVLGCHSKWITLWPKSISSAWEAPATLPGQHRGIGLLSLAPNRVRWGLEGPWTKCVFYLGLWKFRGRAGDPQQFSSRYCGVVHYCPFGETGSRLLSWDHPR